MKEFKEITNIPACPNPKVPGAAARMIHLTDVQLRFNDIDMLGHVNNNVYFELMDLAKSKFFSFIVDGDVDWHNPGVVIVNVNASFFAQAFMGERLGVLTGIVSVSEKSFVVEQRVVNLDTGNVNCVATTVMASFSKETMRSVPIDDRWREALTACMGKRV